MTDYKHIDYRLRCHTKRTDLPADVLRDIGEAYEYINDLQRRIQMLRDGFEGSCTSCEPVGEMNKKLREERDEARRLLKAVVDMMRDNMAHDATHPHHLCDFIHRPDIGMCKVCEDWTDAMVMCYPDDFQDEEETK